MTNLPRWPERKLEKYQSELQPQLHAFAAVFNSTVACHAFSNTTSLFPLSDIQKDVLVSLFIRQSPVPSPGPAPAVAHNDKLFDAVALRADGAAAFSDPGCHRWRLPWKWPATNPYRQWIKTSYSRGLAAAEGVSRDLLARCLRYHTKCRQIPPCWRHQRYVALIHTQSSYSDFGRHSDTLEPCRSLSTRRRKWLYLRAMAKLLQTLSQYQQTPDD